MNDEELASYCNVEFAYNSIKADDEYIYRANVGNEFFYLSSLEKLINISSDNPVDINYISISGDHYLVLKLSKEEDFSTIINMKLKSLSTSYGNHKHDKVYYIDVLIEAPNEKKILDLKLTKAETDRMLLADRIIGIYTAKDLLKLYKDL
jgi:hypothetical protein